MKPVLYIFGDSFSSKNEDSACWINLLENHYSVINFSNRGVSEYRIWKIYNEHRTAIADDSKILFCHTSPFRVYLKDSFATLSRNLETHPVCDIILEDIYSKKEKNLIDAVETIWDEEYFVDTYKLVFKDLIAIKNSYHLTFFETKESILNLNNVWINNKGKINHLNTQGNKIVFDSVLNLISFS
jgi:hypothetical protein